MRRPRFSTWTRPLNMATVKMETCEVLKVPESEWMLCHHGYQTCRKTRQGHRQVNMSAATRMETDPNETKTEGKRTEKWLLEAAKDPHTRTQRPKAHPDSFPGEGPLPTPSSGLRFERRQPQ
ncbi:uncharacterized protein ACOB8E_023000 isoform 1-T1 [Sarcophilus harrisii]